MMSAITRWRDEFLGRGDAAITIPIFDGALKPNRLLDHVAQSWALPQAEDIATDGVDVFVADGSMLLRLNGDTAEIVHQFDGRITALACVPGGGFAVALSGKEVRTIGARQVKRQWNQANGRPFLSVGALSATTDGRLLITDGSVRQNHDRWCHDLMERGKSGRLLGLNLEDGQSHEIASGLAYAFGACQAAGGAWVSESWRHRVMKYDDKGRAEVILDELPAYPCRITAAPGGGFWLTAFAGRTQLVEFVLREDAYRKRMVAEVDPRYWIAPAMHSGITFLEPLQGAGVKMRGVLKPWAPPRSYGLVMRLSADGTILYSMHSRLDGQHHGVVAAVECRSNLYVLSKGSGKLLRLPVEEIERSVRA